MPAPVRESRLSLLQQAHMQNTVGETAPFLLRLKQALLCTGIYTFWSLGLQSSYEISERQPVISRRPRKLKYGVLLRIPDIHRQRIIRHHQSINSDKIRYNSSIIDTHPGSVSKNPLAKNAPPLLPCKVEYVIDLISKIDGFCVQMTS